MPHLDDLKVQPLTQEEVNHLLDELTSHIPDAQNQIAFPDTPQGRLLRLHSEICQEARLLMEKKNHDYASADDPFRNFRLYGLFGVLVRLGDKHARLQSFLEQGELRVEDESLRDTIKDIINYAVIFLGMLNERSPR